MISSMLKRKRLQTQIARLEKELKDKNDQLRALQENENSTDRMFLNWEADVSKRRKTE